MILRFRADGEPTNGYSIPKFLEYLPRGRPQLAARVLGLGGFYVLPLSRQRWNNCNAKADGKCLRYKKGWEDFDYGAEDFVKSFETHLRMIIEDLSSMPVGTNVDVKNDDSRKALSALPRKFRLCITSPPYLNSFDYSDVYRPELFLMEMVRNTQQLRKIRLRTVRSHVQVHWDTPTESNFGVVYKETMGGLRKVEDDLWDKRIPTMVQAYFEDMKCILQQLYRRAKSDAQVWLVVLHPHMGALKFQLT